MSESDKLDRIIEILGEIDAKLGTHPRQSKLTWLISNGLNFLKFRVTTLLLFVSLGYFGIINLPDFLTVSRQVHSFDPITNAAKIKGSGSDLSEYYLSNGVWYNNKLEPVQDNLLDRLKDTLDQPITSDTRLPEEKTLWFLK